MSVGVDIFAVGSEKVDVSGVSIGKGFRRHIKRHNFASNALLPANP